MCPGLVKVVEVPCGARAMGTTLKVKAFTVASWPNWPRLARVIAALPFWKALAPTAGARADRGGAVATHQVDHELDGVLGRTLAQAHAPEVGAEEVGAVAPQPGQEVPLVVRVLRPPPAPFRRRPAGSAGAPPPGVRPRPGRRGERDARLPEEVEVVVLQDGAAVRRERHLALRPAPAGQVRREESAGLTSRASRCRVGVEHQQAAGGADGRQDVLREQKQSGALSLASIAVSLVSQDSSASPGGLEASHDRCCCLLNADAWASYAAASEAFAGRWTTCTAGRSPATRPCPPAVPGRSRRRPGGLRRRARAAPGASSPRRLIPRGSPCIMS